MQVGYHDEPIGPAALAVMSLTVLQVCHRMGGALVRAEGNEKLSRGRQSEIWQQPC
ncbi:hypothetical protein RIEGSTA812A_PEG_210 [invertebrate metagenome]|uniref:Uncharacterized protein n=1 Tax=invertebrate metagenome TaxID=1711999 RepID=A0A484H4R6_9ZZZZ